MELSGKAGRGVLKGVDMKGHKGDLSPLGLLSQRLLDYAGR